MKTNVEDMSPLWQKLRKWLLPLENGSKDIHALDGLRAVAALSVVLYHALLVSRLGFTFFSHVMGDNWQYLLTGVHLFFVLSGFLLFLPYAKAMLRGNKLPHVWTFYKRRALRILPAYWVCLTIVAFLPTSVHITPLNIKDLLVHIVLLHDFFPLYNRDFEGPFWTLAVETQFYVLLPLIAFGISRIVGASRSLSRLITGVLLTLVLALLLRIADGIVIGHLSQLTGRDASFGRTFVLITMGEQGKFLEVFAVGMLCSVLYVAASEGRFLTPKSRYIIGVVLLPIALAVIYFVAPHWVTAVPQYAIGQQWGVGEIAVPALIGVGYGLLLLATVWGNPLLKVLFEWYPMRFIGLISYSLYLWHLPIIHGYIPGISLLPVAWLIVLAFIVAYLSYQFVERPFLRRRQRTNNVSSGAIAASHAVVATPVNMLTYAQQNASRTVDT